MEPLDGFRKLKVWEKAHALVLEVYMLTRKFPEEERFCLTNQIRRSVVSISANIVEGYRKSRKDFLRFLDIAQGSLEETKYHLLLSKDLGYFDVSTYSRLLNLSNEIGKMIYGLSEKLKN